MSRILITAFEPFGLIGAWVRRANASAQVMSEIEKVNGDSFLYKTLPTTKDAIPELLETLEAEKPSGILSMGEHLLAFPEDIKIEPYAHDTFVSTLPLRHLFKNKVRSDFVSQMDDQLTSSLIGGYYCNQVYLQSMNWATKNGNVPVAFTHIPVLGDHEEHTDQVISVLQHMSDYNKTLRGLDR